MKRNKEVGPREVGPRKVEPRKVGLRKAVSLQYPQGSVPRVVHKGEGVMAEEILAIAKELQLPIYENQSLVEQLMKLDYMQEIPEDLYELVAIILAFAYEALGKEPESG